MLIDGIEAQVGSLVTGGLTGGLGGALIGASIDTTVDFQFDGDHVEDMCHSLANRSIIPIFTETDCGPFGKMARNPGLVLGIIFGTLCVYRAVVAAKVAHVKNLEKEIIIRSHSPIDQNPQNNDRTEKPKALILKTTYCYIEDLLKTFPLFHNRYYLKNLRNLSKTHEIELFQPGIANELENDLNQISTDSIDVLWLIGHGNSNVIAFSPQFVLRIEDEDLFRKLVEKMKSTGKAVFQGCSNAKGEENITRYFSTHLKSGTASGADSLLTFYGFAWKDGKAEFYSPIFTNVTKQYQNGKRVYPAAPAA